jgi:UDP-glucose 4-epimerase
MKKNAFADKNILITGGLGFIGSHLARRLVKLGAHVSIIDSLNPDYGGNLFNIRDIKAKVQVNISDVRDEQGMKHLVKKQHYLFNLAGQTSHLDSMQNPQTDLEINAKAQLFILEACRKYNPGIKIVFASTRQIYGKPQYLPVDERHPLCPVDINGVNKLAGEWYHLLYNNVYGIRSVVLRLTNTIGPGMRIKDARQTFLGVWIRLVLEGKPFEVWEGQQLRDFTYVDDCVDAFLLAAASDEVNGQVFNLGGKGKISLAALAGLLIKINGKGKFAVKQFPKERKRIDISDFYADYQLIHDKLGWEPKTGIAAALGKTLGYYKKNLKEYV